MRYHFKGEDIIIPLEFGSFQDPETPDDGTVSYSVRSATATVVPLTPVAAGETEITVPAAINDDGHRWVMFRYEYNGVPKRHIHSYILTDFIPLLISGEDIRAELGVDSDELPDVHLDFFDSMQRLNYKYDLEILVDETKLERDNRLLLYFMAWQMGEKLWLRVKQSQDIQGEKVARISSIDWKRLLGHLENQFVAELTQHEDYGTVTEPTLLLFGSRTDPFTGEDA